MSEPRTSKERRGAQIRAMEPGLGAKALHMEDTEAARRLNALLAYFDEREPAVADAIRYGLKPAAKDNLCCLHIDYPR